MRNGHNLRKQTTLVRVPVRVYSFFKMFYTHTQIMQQHIHYLIICFKSYLCSIGWVRNGCDADISVFFRNSFFFVHRHSDLEGSCSNGTKTRHVNLVVACGP
jgi:hypothetical protein